jgi:peptidoglycan-associated lipoprotein
MRHLPHALIVGFVAMMPAACARAPLPEPQAGPQAAPTSPARTPEASRPVPLPQVPGPMTDSRVDRVSVFFDFDSYVLRPGAGEPLQRIAAAAKRDERPVRIEGHCDERGTPEYNLALGEGRARSAQRYLEALGVPPGKIGVVSFGSTRPRATGHDEASWAENRRGDVILR